MPDAPLRPCLYPGCRQLVKSGRCPQHARHKERQRGSAWTRGYDADWRGLRLLVLSQEPLCRQCQADGRVTAATDVDHVIPIRIRPELRLVRSNLQPLCHECHSRKTKAEINSAYNQYEG